MSMGVETDRRGPLVLFHGENPLFPNPPQEAQSATPQQRKDLLPQQYTEGLTASLQTLNVTEEAFTHAPNRVVPLAERMLQRYEVNPSLIAKKPLRSLLTLAVADEWLQTETVQKKKDLLDVLKVITTGTDHYGTFTTQSGLVQKLTDRGLPRGTLFHPLWQQTARDGQKTNLDENLLKYTDAKLTQEAYEVASRFDKGSKLYTVRNTLGITKEIEKPFEIFVVNKNSLDFAREIGNGGGAFLLGKRIILSSNHMKYNYLDHEYAHVQSDRLSFGLKDLLFSKLDEALTESITTHPVTYPDQRAILDRIQTEQTDLRPALLQSYMGDINASNQMFQKIAEGYGLVGLLALARLGSSVTSTETGYSPEKSFYVHPHTVSRILDKNARMVLTL